MARFLAGKRILSLTISAADPELAEGRGQRQDPPHFLKGEQAAPLIVEAGQRNGETGVGLQTGCCLVHWDQRTARPDA